MDNVTADELPTTNEDFQALSEFFSARRGDSGVLRFGRTREVSL